MNRKLRRRDERLADIRETIRRYSDLRDASFISGRDGTEKINILNRSLHDARRLVAMCDPQVRDKTMPDLDVLYGRLGTSHAQGLEATRDLTCRLGHGRHDVRALEDRIVELDLLRSAFDGGLKRVEALISKEECDLESLVAETQSGKSRFIAAFRNRFKGSAWGIGGLMAVGAIGGAVIGAMVASVSMVVGSAVGAIASACLGVAAISYTTIEKTTHERYHLREKAERISHLLSGHYLEATVKVEKLGKGVSELIGLYLRTATVSLKEELRV